MRLSLSSIKQLAAGATGMTKLSLQRNKEEELRRAFGVFDADGSGSLSKAEIHEIFMRPGGGHALTEAEVEELIAEFDLNGDGELQFEEFCAMWAKPDEPDPKEPKAKGSEKKKASKPAAGASSSGGPKARSATPAGTEQTPKSESSLVKYSKGLRASADLLAAAAARDAEADDAEVP